MAVSDDGNEIPCLGHGQSSLLIRHVAAEQPVGSSRGRAAHTGDVISCRTLALVVERIPLGTTGAEINRVAVVEFLNLAIGLGHRQLRMGVPIVTYILPGAAQDTVDA